MPFKVFKFKKEVAGKSVVFFVCKDGVNGTGITLPHQCGFCRDKDGRPTMAFRSWRQRLQHANSCPK